MTPEERAIQWRRLGHVYDGLATDARRRARALEARQTVPGPYHIEVIRGTGPILADVFGIGGRPVAVELPHAEALRYESLLNAGLMTEAELP